ncbi:hypothetical protein [Maritimibacter sp. HL-12]|uniref:hypothetical protein n=1 Tax=Maritimibacter sp. HL-12 TaxID=1162418 RepID=UPI000A0F181A|nr:hypothetical protein [Maritimibacter sp. HL-12]SMH37972.1 hypothetical protein SAMN05661107_0852 [Maritimibacter sp. HL-12]
MIRAPLPASLTPLATELGLRPFYGDIHNHSDLSYGHGRFADALARAALQLDFVSITGHAHWPDMPVDDPSVAHIVDFHVKGFAKLRAGWMDHFEALKAADGPGFCVFPGYEIHSNADGDYTIVYADLDPAPLHLADTPADLKAALRQSKGARALAFPHHIGYRQGARGINWNTFDPALSPFVEMLSMHGCAETSETDRGYLHSMGPVDGHSTMAHGLAQGHVFGIVGNTDHHSAFPGSYGHGRMCAYARSGGRDDLWQAFMSRATNALTGDNIHLLAAVGPAIQGGIVAPGTYDLRIEAVAGGFIDSIDVIRNGQLWHRISPELDPAPIGAADETLLFLELGWGARRSRHDWTGTLSVEGGEILSAEPRWRGAEVVSPLEGQDGGAPLPELVADGSGLRFAVTAEANPNNFTSATQGMLLRLRLDAGATIRAELCGQNIELPAERLFESAKSGNLGSIDSPAWRFHAMPRPRQWQWHGRVPLGTVSPGENIYLRLRQAGGQMAWTSPVFCRAEQTS